MGMDHSPAVVPFVAAAPDCAMALRRHARFGAVSARRQPGSAGGLVQQPFAAGAEDMIDRVVVEIPNAAAGFALIHGDADFQPWRHRLPRPGAPRSCRRSPHRR